MGKDEMDVGAGDQGIMFGYASDETEDCMPLTHSMATRLGKKLTDVRKDGMYSVAFDDGDTATELRASEVVPMPCVSVGAPLTPAQLALASTCQRPFVQAIRPDT